MLDDFTYLCTLVRWECEKSLERASRAHSYLNGTIDADEAGDIIYDCQPIAGWYPLETFSEESLLDRVTEEYEERPEFSELVHAACRRVWNKWNSSGDTAGAAVDWAMDLFRQYAQEDGVELKHTPEYADEEETA
jgi:predicted metal-binding protein